MTPADDLGDYARAWDWVCALVRGHRRAAAAPLGRLPLESTGVILALYAGSFALMFLALRPLASRPHAGADVPRLGIALLLPTLVLDALASAFFPAVYPNFPA